jgi:protease II
MGLLGDGPSGGLSALTVAFQEPYLFEAIVAHNPITDLLTHMLEDIEDRQFLTTTESLLDFELMRHRKLAEFGDPSSPLFFEMQRLISPYHMPLIEDDGMRTNLMLSVDTGHRLRYHSRKLACKLRHLLTKENSWAFYDEQNRKELDQNAKFASFLVHSLML